MAFFQTRPLRAAILSAALLASGAQAADEGAAEYREAIFEAIGGHMSAMVGIIKGEVPHQQDLALHAKGIAALAPVTQHIFPLSLQMFHHELHEFPLKPPTWWTSTQLSPSLET